MARTKKRALWWASAPNYSEDPSPSGAGYSAVPAVKIGDRKGDNKQIPTGYMTGRNFETSNIPGPDGGEFEVEVPAIGLATAAGAVTAPPAIDWFDIALDHIHGDLSVRSGVALTGASANALTLATDALNLQDLVAVYQANIPAGGPRSQFGLISTDAGSGTYDVHPPWATVPSAAAIAYGARVFRFDDDGGPGMAAVYRNDDQDFTLLGMRAQSCVVGWDDAGVMVTYKLRFRYDRAIREDKASLPVVLAAPAVTPIRSLLSGIWFNGTLYETAKASFDYGLVTSEIRSSSRPNGRAGDELMKAMPKLTLSPIGGYAIEQLQRDATVGRLVMQLGGGVLSGGALNTIGIAAAAAQVVQESDEDDSGRRRKAITIEVKDPVYFTGTVPAVFLQTVRS